MKLIKDLGMLKINPIKGAVLANPIRYGVYLCPDCKKETIVMTKNVLNKRTKRCKACGYKTNHSKYGTTGNATTDPLYRCWVAMRSRCNNKKSTGYKRYGGRGIKVCKEWEDFNTFKLWATSAGYKEKLTLDRINNDLGYSPDNCRYVTRYVQAHNQRTLRSSNTLGFKGIYWNKQKKKYEAKITHKHKKYHIGFFTTLLEAAKAHDTFVISKGFPNTINGV